MTDGAPARPTLRQNLRSLPREAWILFAGAFVNRLGSFVLPFMTLYLTGLGYRPAQAGLGLASYGVGALLAQGVGGLLADRIGRRNAIIVSMLGGGASALSLLLVDGLWAVVGVVGLMGFLGELYRPASSALVADLVPVQARVAAFSAYRMMLNIGWAVGFALGGLLFDRNPRLLFVGDAATSFGFALVAWRALPHGVRTTKHEERHLERARTSILRDRGFLLFLGAVFLTAVVFMQNASTFALHLNDLGYSASTYGALLALSGVLVVALELPVTSWTQHRRRTTMVAFGALLVGLGFFMLSLADTLPILVLMVIVWTLGQIVESPASSAFVSDRAPEHVRGRYQGALGSMFASAAIVGPLLGTVLYDVSPDLLWIACGGVGLASAVLAIAAGRRPAPA